MMEALTPPLPRIRLHPPLLIFSELLSFGPSSHALVGENRRLLKAQTLSIFLAS
jgi:hypothetical protein